MSIQDEKAAALFAHRESIDLTADNAEFSVNDGGLTSLRLKTADGEEFFDRVVVRNCFPVSMPEEYLSVREPDSKEKGKGDEIGMIRRLSDFSGASRDAILHELHVRYFVPEILHARNFKEKGGYSYLDIETEAGETTVTMRNPFDHIRTKPDGKLYVYDLEGNCFVVSDLSRLDKASAKLLSIYAD